jgi:hypothetical protein
MKIQTTKKAILNGFNTVLSIGYCDVQYLLNYKSPFAYSAGVYGWSCDYYQIGNVCISTGYSPIGTQIKDYSKVREIEKQAQTICCNYDLKHEDKLIQLDALIAELIALN